MKFGAIFDWDGVVIDSAAQHKESWNVLAEEQGRDLPPGFFEETFGKRNVTIIPEHLKWTTDAAEVDRLSRRKEEIYRELIKANGIEPLPGVRPLLEDLAAYEVPCAVGSSTERANIETVLEILGFTQFFQAIVAADDVTHGKPHPEVFLTCAERINRDPQNCVVFEDAHHGVEAGLAGGMKVVAIANTHPRESFDQAHRSVDSLEELDLAALQELWAH